MQSAGNKQQSTASEVTIYGSIEKMPLLLLLLLLLTLSMNAIFHMEFVLHCLLDKTAYK